MSLSPEQEKLRKRARDLLLRARFYRFCAVVFALIGLAIFLFLYFRHMDGRLLEALTSIKTVVIILLSFLPAAVLAMLAARTESRFYDILHSPGPESSGKKKS